MKKDLIFIRSVKEFFEFLHTLYGLLTLLVIIMPFLNRIFAIFPTLTDMRDLQMSLAFISAFFSMSLIFTLRHNMLRFTFILSLVSFLLGLTFFSFYLIHYFAMGSFKAIPATKIIISYALSVSFFASAFSFIAIREYYYLKK